MDKYILSLYYPRSEGSYAFGPFTGEAVDKFIQDNNLDPEDVAVSLFNDPALYGTGYELSQFP